jgi:response regulator RpfG family c-di-GMP phosphodiesterase
MKQPGYPRILAIRLSEAERTRVSEAVLAATGADSLLHEANDIDETLDRIASGPWDVALLAIDGTAEATDLIVRLQAALIDTTLLLVTRQPSVDLLATALRLGVGGCITDTDSADEIAATVVRGVHRAAASRSLRQQREEDEAALERQRKRVDVLESQLTSLQEAVIEALLTAQEAREAGARVHSQRVRAYAAYFADVCNYPKSLRPHLERAALLHDIGKIALADDVLRRPGILMPEALEDLKPHAVMGEKILNGIEFLRPAALIVRHHHERFDGSGYPDGLSSESIPLGARLFSIVDALDAVTNNQNYRTAQPFDDAIEEIARWSGRQFDPYLIAQFRQVAPGVWTEIRTRVEEEERDWANPVAPAEIAKQSA